MRRIALLIIPVVLSGLAYAAPASPAAAPETVAEDSELTTGYYSAEIPPTVCGGCKALIEQTMKKVEGIGAAQVDAQATRVKFTVMKGESVSLAALQAALDGAAKRMGMGADYKLKAVEPLKK